MYLTKIDFIKKIIDYWPNYKREKIIKPAFLLKAEFQKISIICNIILLFNLNLIKWINFFITFGISCGSF
jgi:hypothetical protein